MKYINKNKLKNVIEPQLHHLLNDHNYEILELDPKKLLSPNRLDIIYKILYLRGINKRSDYATQCYLEHIRCFNFGKYSEFGNPKKNSAKNFLRVFKEIDKEIELAGFDSSKSIIPLASDGSILNGSHRIASSIVRNKKVSCIKLSCDPCIYDYNFFVNRLVNKIWLEDIILNYLIESNHFSVALVWPRANLKNKTLKKFFEKIIYFKEIKININGLDQLIKLVYKDEDWINKTKNNQGSMLKTTKCFKINKPIKLIIFESRSTSYDLKVKSNIRDFCKVGNHSIHTTDNKSDAIRIAKILLNENSINFINNHCYKNKKENINYLIDLERKIKNSNFLHEDCIMSYKSSLNLYGLKKNHSKRNNKIYSLNKNKKNKKIKNFNIINISAKEKLPSEIFFNPNYFFWYRNLKFISSKGILYLHKNGFIRLNKQKKLDLININNTFNKSLLIKMKVLLFYFFNILKFKAIQLKILITIYLGKLKR